MKKITILFSCLFIFLVGYAQQESELNPLDQLEQQTQKQDDEIKVLQKLKVSGYIQTQFQYGEKDASLKLGAVNENRDKSFNRIGIRRGRIKFVYEEGITSGIFQLDITEKGVGLKDVYLKDEKYISILFS